MRHTNHAHCSPGSLATTSAAPHPSDFYALLRPEMEFAPYLFHRMRLSMFTVKCMLRKIEYRGPDITTVGLMESFRKQVQKSQLFWLNVFRSRIARNGNGSDPESSYMS